MELDQFKNSLKIVKKYCLEEIAKIFISNSTENYSTDEQIVGTWIDRKLLYQKTIAVTGHKFSTNVPITVPIGVSNINQIVHIQGIMTNTTNGNTSPIPYTNPYSANVGGNATGISYTSPNIIIRVGTDWPTGVAYNVYATIKYTKTG